MIPLNLTSLELAAAIKDTERNLQAQEEKLLKEESYVDDLRIHTTAVRANLAVLNRALAKNEED